MVTHEDASRIWLAHAAIALVVVVVFHRVLSAGFGGWDDELNLVNNTWLNPPSLEGVWRYWRAPAYDLYVPVTYTLWSVVAALAFDPLQPVGGAALRPGPFHALNLLLHVLSAICVFEIVRRTSARRSIAAAVFGAIVFAVHPMQVESVAWAAGAKDVLAGALGLGVMLCVVGAWGGSEVGGAERRSAARTRWMLRVGAGALLGLALLSKPSAVVVPAMALVLLMAPSCSPAAGGRGPRSFGRAFGVLWPLIVMAAACVIWTKWFQRASDVAAGVPVHVRPLVALDTFGFYLIKLAWPAGLGVDYGRTPQWVLESGAWLNTGALAIAVALSLAWLARRGGSGRLPLVGLVLFTIGVAPVLGLIAFDFQAYSTVADHYVYMAMLGPAVVVAGAIDAHELVGAELRSAAKRGAMWAGAVVVTGALAIASYRQTKHWAGAMAISMRAVEVNPRSFAWHNRLGVLLSESGDVEAAVEHWNRAVEIEPRYGTGWRHLGYGLSLLPGRAEESIAAYRRAIANGPNDATALGNLAGLLAERGEYDEAIALFERALVHAPTWNEARAGLARARFERTRAATAPARPSSMPLE